MNVDTAANKVGELWLSKRQPLRAGDSEWNSFIQFVGLTHLREVRTIDSAWNSCLEADFPLRTLDELWARENEGMLPFTTPNEYYLLFTDASGMNGSLAHSRLTLLGYDLSDETWTSSLLNCGRWQGALEPIAQRTGENGLVSLEDAMLALSLLPEAWDGDPHSYVTVWALFEVTPPQDSW